MEANVEISHNDIIDIRERLAAIEESLKHPSPTCAVHSEQILAVKERVASLEAQQAKHNIIAATLGVIGASIVLTIKYVAGKL